MERLALLSGKLLQLKLLRQSVLKSITHVYISVRSRNAGVHKKAICRKISSFNRTSKFIVSAKVSWEWARVHWVLDAVDNILNIVQYWHSKPFL